ncbi:MAG: cyclic nucleotide-binding domain-containing protein [Gallionellaceae bacterium]|nr:MAG: cyclic nucleotide-binding domain-containing protein [Gallionellaceae bacterium]
MSNEMEIFVKLISLAKCLKGFGVEDLRDLLSISSKAVWKTGEHVFIEGEQGRDMFIICSGKVSIWRKSGGEKVSLANLAEGESFGEMGLIRGGERSAGATALEPTVALRISYEHLHQAPSAAVTLYRNLARELAERLKIANDIIVFQTQAGAEPPPLMTIGRSHHKKAELYKR